VALTLILTLIWGKVRLLKSKVQTMDVALMRERVKALYRRVHVHVHVHVGDLTLCRLLSTVSARAGLSVVSEIHVHV